MARKQDSIKEQDIVEEKPAKSKEKQDSRSKPRSSRRRVNSKQAVKKSTKSQNPVIRYFQDTNEELKKVTWPTQEQTTRLSIIVLISTVISGIVLFSFDLGFQQFIALLINLVE